MEAETFEIDEVASRLGTSVRTLRNYKEQGLVRPLRTSGGTRLHSAEHIERLRAA